MSPFCAVIPSDSVFNNLGSDSTFRKLVKTLKENHLDPQMMLRAFTPSVEEIKQFGIKSAQLITSCSIDGATCSHEYGAGPEDGGGGCRLGGEVDEISYLQHASNHILYPGSIRIGAKLDICETFAVLGGSLYPFSKPLIIDIWEHKH